MIIALLILLYLIIGTILTGWIGTYDDLNIYKDGVFILLKKTPSSTKWVGLVSCA